MVCAILVPKYGYLWFKLYAILEISARPSYGGRQINGDRHNYFACPYFFAGDLIFKKRKEENGLT